MPAEGVAPPDMTISEYMHYFACAKGVPRRERQKAVDEAAVVDAATRSALAALV